jgi:hypothetical protein
MQDLIRRCWLPDPQERPSFDDILSQLQDRRFQISDTTISTEIEDFCEAILDWERRSPNLKIHWPSAVSGGI